MEHHSILRVVSKLLIPPILLYALYVQFHGEYGPGGGFQAGVIFAVAFILYALVFGIEAMTEILPPHLLLILSATGVLIFAGTGVVTMLLGDAYLGYNALAADPPHAQEWGIVIVEIGVGMTVAAVMMAIFVAFASHNPPIKDEDW